MTTTIPKLRFHEPVRNLPGHPAGRSAEDRLALHFARAFTDEQRGGESRANMAIARQIPVNGYGIADIVAVNWESQTHPSLQAFLCEAKTTVFAFEVKLRDWRKAIMQANRYRFFAHVAIVVLPEDGCGAALKFLDTFHVLDVGLWSFDVKSRRITSHFTPAPAQPTDTRHAVSALRLVAKASKALPIS